MNSTQIEKPGLVISEDKGIAWKADSPSLVVHIFFIGAFLTLLAILAYALRSHLVSGRALTAFALGEFTGALLIRGTVWILCYRMYLLSKRKICEVMIATLILSLSLFHPQLGLGVTLILYFAIFRLHKNTPQESRL